MEVLGDDGDAGDIEHPASDAGCDTLAEEDLSVRAKRVRWCG